MNAPVTTLKTAAEAELARQFAEISGGLKALRTEAFRRVEAMGLPHRRIEAWHYTDLRAMMRSALPRAKAPAGRAPEAAAFADAAPPERLEAPALRAPPSHDDRLALADMAPPVFHRAAHLSDLDLLLRAGPRFAFVDGYLTGTPRLPAGVAIRTLATQPTEVGAAFDRAADLSHDIVAQLNTAFMTSGLVIDVAAGAHVGEILTLAFVTTGATASYGRVVVSVGAGASLTLVETHRGEPGGQANTVVEVVLGAGASVEHVRVNAHDATTQVLSTLAVGVAKEASFQTLNFTTGGGLSRHQVFARVHGDDARIGVRGVSLLMGEQHGDNTLVVEHDALRGESRELFRTVLDGEAKGVFQGKIVVKPHAQKTDGRMASNALLLGQHAVMHGKPELEIFADDVVCAHGMTVGALDDDLLFYLMSRGVSRKEAEGLMIQAFAGEAIEAVAHEGLREALSALTADWVGSRG